MAEREIVWTQTAGNQLREILEFWVEKNKSKVYSSKLLDKIESGINTIKNYPDSLPNSSISGIRVSALGHYSIFYRRKLNTIYIMAIWDNRQDPMKLLEILKKSN